MSNYKSINFKTQNVKKINLPLCNNGEFKYTDIKQGNYGYCWFLTALSSYLRIGPNLQERENKLRNKIKHLTDNLYLVKINGLYFIVDDYVLVEYDISNSVVMWPLLFEKAMLSFMSNNYEKHQSAYICKNINPRIGENNAGSLGLKMITGYNSRVAGIHPFPNFELIDEHRLLDLWNRECFMSTNTNIYTFQKNPKIVQKENVVRNHSYSIINIWKNGHTTMITLYNPHGISNSTNQESNKFGEFNYTYDQFFKIFSCLHYTYK